MTVTPLTRVTSEVLLAAFPEVRLTDTALVIDKPLSFKRWQELGEVLQFFERSSAWLLGEWAIYGERNYGEAYAQAISDESGYAVETVKVAQWVAERIPPERRHPDLSWAHHRSVAALEPEEQDRWLSTAVDEKLTTRELYERSHPKREEQQPPPPNEPPPDIDEGLEAALRMVLEPYVERDHLPDVVAAVVRVVRSRGAE